MADPPKSFPGSEQAVESLAGDMFRYLQGCFPVCCESDEFYYFPQLVPHAPDWSRWDDFSAERVREVERRLSRFESRLAALSGDNGDLETLTDIETLISLSKTLREQLTEVRFQSDQPTFYLTVACIGLASALTTQDQQAWTERAAGLPSFLKAARESLKNIPALFRDMGIRMVREMTAWLKPLGAVKEGVPPLLEALESFHQSLANVSTRESFLLPRDLFDLVIRDHMRCGVGADEVRNAIEDEIAKTKTILEQEAEKILPGSSWGEAVRHIGAPQLPDKGPTELFRREIENLLAHCIGSGIVSSEFSRLYPVRVSVVPPYLATIRAASSYSFSPAGPSFGGTFSIVPAGEGWDNNREDLIDYRMLTAHETYPGHHLLDASRWHGCRSVRRPIETPLFYEGWACFAEELMRQTGYFTGKGDLMLLAKRRYRRALRGLVDLDLQTGKMDLQSAAAFLAERVFDESAAASAVPKYALRPGYQVCYTFGLTRFLDLYRQFGEADIPEFVRAVLVEGEIDFPHLEKILKRHGAKDSTS